MKPWLWWAILFALAYGQSPLFTSNQNQYFLHAFAQAGRGQLANDWLANTLDPTPVFTALSVLALHAGGRLTLYVLYGVLLAVYFVSLRAIVFRRWNLDASPLQRTLTCLAVLILHSAALRVVLGRWLGPEEAFLLEGGLAGQRLLGTVLQPSAFGVFLVASIALFLGDRPFAAVAAAALAATLHPTYLLAAAALTAGYLWLVLVRDHQLRRALALAGLALALVLPTLVATYRVFQPTSPSLARQAADILVSFRLPHHAQPARWFGPSALAQLFLVAVGIALTYRSRLGPILAITAALAGALTALTLLLDNPRMALLFPWRPSVLLVPLSSALIAGRLVRALAVRLEPRLTSTSLLRAGALGLAGGLALVGLGRTVVLHQARQADPAAKLYEYVQSSLEPGQTYLIPPKLQDFRLATGAPIFVDFKSIPYRDIEVIEWEERVQLAQFFYRDDPKLIPCNLLQRIDARAGITHVVLESDQFGADCPGLESLYQGEQYAVFRYRPAVH